MAPARRPASPRTAIAGDRGSACGNYYSGPSLGATGFVPGWCAENGGMPCCRKPDSGAIHASRKLRRFLAWRFSAGSSLRPFLKPFLPPQRDLRLLPPPPISLSQGIYHDVQDRGSAPRTSHSEPLLGATGSVPGWCGGYGGMPCCRNPGSGAIHGSRNLGRLRAG